MSHKDGSPTCAPATVGPSQKALPPLASVAVAGAACAGAAAVQTLMAAASAARRNRMRHDRTQMNARAHLTFGRRRPRPSGQIARAPSARTHLAVTELAARRMPPGSRLRSASRAEPHKAVSNRVRRADDELLFPTPRGEPWRDHDYRNWRKRWFQKLAPACGLSSR